MNAPLRKYYNSADDAFKQSAHDSEIANTIKRDHAARVQRLTGAPYESWCQELRDLRARSDLSKGNCEAAYIIKMQVFRIMKDFIHIRESGHCNLAPTVTPSPPHTTPPTVNDLEAEMSRIQTSIDSTFDYTKKVNLLDDLLPIASKYYTMTY
tara:strand:- start:1275 stop:1733 length:459 start_codon:yes stop_codon:yes gene_type:complete